jgi:hypothetical protein
MSRWVVTCLITLWAVLGVSAPACAETVFPPGLRIGLEPPGDLQPSTRFSGFEDFDRKVAISILDLPAGAYAELERSANAKDTQGLAGVKRESFSFLGGTGLLLSGRAQGKDVTLHKWILLATASADKDLTALINVEVPEAALAFYSDAVIRKALASVTFRPAPIQEQLGMLPFKLAQPAGFRAMKVFPPSGLILTDGPTDDLSKQAYVIVTIGRGSPEQADDRARFARDLLSQAPLRNIRMQSTDAMRIGGSPGFEIRAQAEGLKGEPVMVAQWLRFSGGSYLRVVGIGGKDNWDALFTRFRALRDAIELR